MSILDVTARFFKEEAWPFNQLEAQPILHVASQGENGQWDCFALAREEQQQLVFYSVCPVTAPKERRAAVMEFLTRANHGLTMGNFEIDLSDGEIRFKTSIDVEGDRLSVALVQQLVYANVLTMDRYLPGIMKVTHGDMLPAEAIVEIEG
ncbi:MAG: YbjN domain-containing protein [Anaerolineae bacterium]|jgi:hypothetical protein